MSAMTKQRRKHKLWAERTSSRDRTRSKWFRIGTRRWKAGQRFDPRREEGR